MVKQVSIKSYEPFLEGRAILIKTLAVFDLADDLNVLALLAKDCADVPQVLCTPNEGGKDHVNVILHAKSQIAFVLL